MSNAHALIIDDNAQNLRILAQMLSKQGLSTTDVTDSSQLTAIIPTLGRVDVVFLDLEMPGLTGYEAITLLRAHYPNTPIIACTVHTAEINHARDAGFDGFVGKPLDISRFPDQLSRILRGEQVWDRS
jgi:two-component system cell cycle response regulator DivK